MSVVTQTVQELKASLLKELDKHDDIDVDRCRDILQRLEECDLDLPSLTETLIGTVVSKFKTHDQLGPIAKGLIKKWKQVAKGDQQHKQQPPPQPPQRSVSLSSLPESEWAGLPPHRQNICQKLHELLLLAKPTLIHSGVNADAIQQLTGPRAAEIEAAIAENYRDKKAYTDKARSLAFNLKKNIELLQEVLLGSVSAGDLVQMSSEQLASAETRQQRADEAKKLIESKRLDWEQANEDKINEMCGIKGDLLKASLFTCGRCKSTKTTSTQKQTRSADEPMTVFVLCLNCGKRWKC